MNVTFLCKRFYTNKDLIKDRYGRLYHLPASLAELGHNVSVLALDYRSSRYQEFNIGNVTFYSFGIKTLYFFFKIKTIIKILRATRPDIIVSSGDSHIGFLGLKFSREMGVPAVFDVYDYYPSFATNLFPGFKRFFFKTISESDLVTVASSSLEDLAKKYNHNVIVVRNGVDRNLFKISDKLLSKKKYGLDHVYPIIGYFGSINRNRGPLLIEACIKLRSHYPNLLLLLAGKVNNVNIEYDWVLYKGEVDQYEVVNLINACDVVTLPYADSEFNRYSGACKISEYIACGVKVVATDVSDHRFFTNYGVQISKVDSSSMACALKDCIRTGVRNYPECLDLSWDSIATQFSLAIINVVKFGSRNLS